MNCVCKQKIKIFQKSNLVRNIIVFFLEWCKMNKSSADKDYLVKKISELEECELRVSIVCAKLRKKMK